MLHHAAHRRWRTALALLAILALAPASRAQAVTWNRRAAAMSVTPADEGMYDVRVAWHVELEGPPSEPLDLSTVIRLEVNGQQGVLHPLYLPVLDSMDLLTDLGRVALAPGDNVFVILETQTGALPETSTSDDTLRVSFDGPISWERDISNVAVLTLPKPVFTRSVSASVGTYDFTVQGSMGHEGVRNPFDLSMNVELRVGGVAVATQRVDAPIVPDPDARECPNSVGCGGRCNLSDPLQIWQCGGPPPCYECLRSWVVYMPAVRIDPGDQVEVELLPAPGSLLRLNAHTAQHDWWQLMELAVNVAGGGAVSRDPDQVRYAPGASVRLTATPAAGYVFQGWSGDATGTANPLAVTMDRSKNITATFGLPSAVPDAALAQFALALSAAMPARGKVPVEFSVPRQTPVRLTVVDVRGREVARLADGVFAPGRHRATWNGQTSHGKAPAGVFKLRLQAAGQSLVRRLVLVH